MTPYKMPAKMSVHKPDLTTALNKIGGAVHPNTQIKSQDNRGLLMPASETSSQNPSISFASLCLYMSSPLIAKHKLSSNPCVIDIIYL